MIRYLLVNVKAPNFYTLTMLQQNSMVIVYPIYTILLTIRLTK